MEILQEMKRVFVSPSMVFEEQVEKRELKKGVAIVAIVFAIEMLVQIFIELADPEMEALLSSVESTSLLITGVSILVLIAGVITFMLMLIGLGIGTGILHVSAKICGGNGSYKSLYVCILFLQAIGIVLVPVSLLKPFIVSGTGMMALAAGIIIIGVGICFSVWSICLNVIMLKKCYVLSTGKAALALLLPSFVLILLMAAVIYSFS